MDQVKPSYAPYFKGKGGAGLDGDGMLKGTLGENDPSHRTEREPLPRRDVQKQHEDGDMEAGMCFGLRFPNTKCRPLCMCMRVHLVLRRGC